MSGRNVGQMPKTGAEWVREVERRLKALETSGTVRVGGWVFNEVDGEIVATKPGRSAVVLTAALADTAAAEPFRRTVKIITITGAPTGGTWTITWRGVMTTEIPFNAAATAVRDALVAIASPAVEMDIDVTGDPGGPYTVVYPGGQFNADGQNLTGGDNPHVYVTPTSTTGP